MPTIAFKASSKHGHTTAHTARKAAEAFFTKYPNARKCDIIQGEDEGLFFVVRFTIGVKSTHPTRWEDVTKKTLPTLPDTNPQDVAKLSQDEMEHMESVQRTESQEYGGNGEDAKL